MSSVWQYAKSFGDTNQNMLDNDALCDVIFVLGAIEEEIKCHKFMLASRSSVFYAMFCGSLAEIGEKVTVPDVEPCVWKTFLRFIYTGDCDLADDTVMEVLYVAKKYDVRNLLDKCREFVEKCINVENACNILTKSQAYDEVTLKKCSLDIIATKTKAVLETSAFYNLSKHILLIILQLDKVNCDEEHMYKVCKMWANERCKEDRIDDPAQEILREKLADILPHIRFCTMTVEKFIGSAADDNILNAEEKISVVKDIVRKTSASGFSGVSREVKPVSSNVVKQQNTPAYRPTYRR